MTSTDEDNHQEFIDPARRVRVVKLEYPFTYKGEVIEEVTIRRLTAREVADFIERVQAAPEAERKAIQLPMFSVSDEVMGMLDDDDAEVIGEAAQAFLPRRFRAAAA